MKAQIIFLLLFCMVVVHLEAQNSCNPIITSDDHTIILQASANPTLDGNPLPIGTHIAVLYDSLGTLTCAGSVIWNGTNTGITVYGDDNTTTLPDGFAVGEVFQYRIELANGTIINNVIATYQIGGIFTSDSTFAVNGISALGSFTVSSCVLTATETVTNVACNNGTNGAIDLTPANGTAPYTYAWSNNATTEDLTGLSAGNYTCTITDANNCTFITNSIAITEPTAIATTETVTNVTCNNGTNGAIDLTITGGIGNYLYAWSNNATTEDLTGLAAGNYTCTITDANNCTFITNPITILEPIAITATEVVTNVPCNAGTNGAIDLTVTGGTGNYLYAWSNNATTEDLIGLSAGSYTCTITDANNCTFVTNPITITEPTAIAATEIITNATCSGGTDGAIDLTVTGGTGNYLYAWSNNATTEDLTGLSAGNYTCTITDANNCTFVTNPITITEPTAIAATAITTNTTCNGGTDGAIDLTVTGGFPIAIGTYTYAWSNGVITEDLTGLAAGNYTCTITDANNCTFITNPISVSEPIAISTTETVTNVTCNGGTNGAIDLTVTGGTGNYTYTWSNNTTTEDLTGLSVGTYICTITDANNCTFVTNPIAITQSLSISTTEIVTNVTCNGGADGAIDLTVTGGFPIAIGTYTYAWSNGGSTEDITGLSVGSYTCTITDVSGCSFVTNSISITEPMAIAVSEVVTNISCNGLSDGAIDLTVTGGFGTYTYVWSNNATTEDVTGLSTGSYTCTITDANNCTFITNTFTVTEPTAIAVTETTTNITCNGGTNSAIDLTVTGGTGNYLYAWSNNATTEDLTGLAAGNYTCTITDANNCTFVTNTITLNEPTAIVATETTTNITCNGGTNGAIDLTVTGGTGNYLYAWSNNATTEDLTGLAAGNYTCTITDANNCTFITNPITILEPIAITATEVVTNVPCNGGTNGAIDLTVTGGTGNYSYIWSNNATTEDLTGLSAGSYTCTITDANNCTFVTNSILVSESLSISTTEITTNVTCNNGADGAIDLTIVGGFPIAIGTYTYLWSNNATTEDITGLSAGNYTCTITDANNCTFVTNPITITEPTAITATEITTNVSCNNLSDGAIDLTVTGGTGNYLYAWSNNATTEDITGLSAGNYTCTITDANNCTFVTNPITITEPTAITATEITTNISCNNLSDGAIDLTVTGGTGNYLYAWSNNVTTEDLTGLAAGNYTCTITDTNNCTFVTNPIAITEPTAITATEITTNVSCNNLSDGAIDLTVTGGIPIAIGTYTYLWSNNATTEDLTGLSAGSYTCTITDANNCTFVTNPITITEPTAITATEITTNISCNGLSDGAIDLTVTGGTGNYLYAWSNNATTEDLTGLSAGSYTCTITDANNCTFVTNPITITEPTAITATEITTNISCNGLSDGAIDLTVTGGIPIAIGTYTYLWSNNATTEDLTGLAAGNYTCTITDANNCTFVTNPITITEPTAITAIEVVTNVSCNGLSDGAIDLIVTGGTGNYTYVWSNNATTEDLTGLSAGTYTCTITDANNCTFVTNSITITEPTAITATEVVTNISCNGLSDGAIDLIVTGGTGNYTYLWSNNATTEDLTGLAAGNYTCTITDANNCTFVTNPITITEPTAITATETITNIVCNGAMTGAIDLTVTGGFPIAIGTYTYAWSNNATTEDLTGLAAGNYTCTITDANNCTFVTNPITITEPTAIIITETVTNISCNGLTDGAIDLTVTGGAGNYTYAWSNNATTEDLTGLAAGNYTCTVTDANNCAVTTTNINIVEPAILMITDTIITDDPTGNGDGMIDITVSGGTTPYTFLWSNGATTEDITNLSQGFYSCTITDVNNCTVILNAVYLTVVNTKEILGVKQLNIFPNPSSTYLNVALELTKPTKVNMTLFSSLGRKMEEKIFDQHSTIRYQYDLSNYSPGVYYLNFQLNGQVFTRRVVVVE